jgi:hypothetical protein
MEPRLAPVEGPPEPAKGPVETKAGQPHEFPMSLFFSCQHKLVGFSGHLFVKKNFLLITVS